MPAILLSLFSSPVVRYALLAGVILLAALTFVKVKEHEAVQSVVAQEKAATAAESLRRQQAIKSAQDSTQAKIDAYTATVEKRNAALVNQVKSLSAANDQRTCLDRAAAQRLRAIGASRQAPRR